MFQPPLSVVRDGACQSPLVLGDPGEVRPLGASTRTSPVLQTGFAVASGEESPAAASSGSSRESASGGSGRRRLRQCVGCGQRSVPSDLIRFVLGPEGEVVVDLAARSFGRGVWCHPRLECLTRAAKHGFSRAAKRRVEVEPEQLLAEVSGAAERRALGLVASAIGAKKAVFGGDRVTQDAASLCQVILAEDARDAAGTKGITELAAQGRVLIWGRKAEFGRLFGRSAVAVFGLQDAGIAKAIVHAIGLARLAPQDSDERKKSSEVR